MMIDVPADEIAAHLPAPKQPRKIQIMRIIIKITIIR